MREPSENEELLVLFDIYADEIFRFARYMLGNHTEAKDVVQETFLRAFKEWKLFRKESSYKTWLLSIARNYMYDLLRKRKTELNHLQHFSEQMEHNNTAVTADLLDLEAALQKLKPTYRQVVVLRYIREMAVPEVAEILGWTEGKVRTTLHRALKRLREILSERGTTQ